MISKHYNPFIVFSQTWWSVPGWNWRHVAEWHLKQVKKLVSNTANYQFSMLIISYIMFLVFSWVPQPIEGQT